MAVRFRKYFPQCKLIPCSGRPNKSYCPSDRPKRANSEFKDCGVWCIEFFDDSKQWQSLTFKDVRNKTEAEKRLTLFISDRERGKLNLPKKKAVPTLAEYSRAYLESHRGAKENTLCARKRAVNVLVEYLGSYPLDKITAFVIEKYRIDRKEKDQVKDSTINDDVSTLGHIFGRAIKEGILDKNLCKDIKKLKVTQSRERVLNAEEIAMLLDKLEGKCRFMVLTGLFTGMRLGEVLRLKWTDIDFAKCLITFIQSKTSKQVTVPLSSYLADELTKYKEGHTEERLFEVKEITNAVVIRYSEYFSKLFKELGIHDFTYHNLRHSFASLHGDIGTGAIVTQNILGHSKVDMTLRYSHIGLESKKRAVQALTDHVLGMSEKAILPLVIQKTGTA